jgi:hypothetical protein
MKKKKKTLITNDPRAINAHLIHNLNKLFDIGYCLMTYDECVDLDKVSEALTCLAQEIQNIGKEVLGVKEIKEPPEDSKDD